MFVLLFKKILSTFSALKSFVPSVGKVSSFFSSNETDRGIFDIFNGLLELGSRLAIFIKAPAFLLNFPEKKKKM